MRKLGALVERELQVGGADLEEAPRGTKSREMPWRVHARGDDEPEVGGRKLGKAQHRREGRFLIEHMELIETSTSSVPMYSSSAATAGAG